MKKVIKSVSFNAADPDQAKMLEHANKRSSFSGYIKRLIQRDLEGWFRQEQPQTEVDNSIDENLMRGMI